MATTIERITPHQARDHMRSGDSALLVCAYDSEEQFRQNHLEGAIDLESFAAQADTISRDREIIFYCA